jgi:hypothetical protein
MNQKIPAETIVACWNLVRGSTFDLSWTWKQNGTPVVTTGGTCEAIFRAVYDGAALLTANTGNAKVTVNTAGVFTWDLAPADIALLGDSGIWDLKFTEAGGDVRSVTGGRYTVVDDN